VGITTHQEQPIAILAARAQPEASGEDDLISGGTMFVPSATGDNGGSS
jgi:hypothetical protein